MRVNKLMHLVYPTILSSSINGTCLLLTITSYFPFFYNTYLLLNSQGYNV